MTEEVRQLLEAKAPWFDGTGKKVWQPEELAHAYVIYNLHTGDSRHDTGCSSCRRSIIKTLKNLYKLIPKD